MLCLCAQDVSEITGLLFYHAAIMVCLQRISSLCRCSRCAWDFLIFDCLVKFVYSTLENHGKQRHIYHVPR